MSNKHVSLVLIDRDSSDLDEIWGRGFIGISHFEFTSASKAREFFCHQDYKYNNEYDKEERFVLIPYMGKK